VISTHERKAGLCPGLVCVPCPRGAAGGGGPTGIRPMRRMIAARLAILTGALVVLMAVLFALAR
jgi:hypothetical protein